MVGDFFLLYQNFGSVYIINIFITVRHNPFLIGWIFITRFYSSSHSSDTLSSITFHISICFLIIRPGHNHPFLLRLEKRCTFSSDVTITFTIMALHPFVTTVLLISSIIPWVALLLISAEFDVLPITFGSHVYLLENPIKLSSKHNQIF